MIEAIAIESSPDLDQQRTALLAVVADPVRWRLLAQLGDGGTHCVCKLHPMAGVAANVLSYHLRVLRETGLVTSAKRGRWVDYTLASDAAARLAAALPTATSPTATSIPRRGADPGPRV